jgi:hypothetical protein
MVFEMLCKKTDYYTAGIIYDYYMKDIYNDLLEDLLENTHGILSKLKYCYVPEQRKYKIYNYYPGSTDLVRTLNNKKIQYRIIYWGLKMIDEDSDSDSSCIFPDEEDVDDWFNPI